MSAYTVPQKREGSDDDDDGLPAALVSPDEQEMRIEIGELLGLPRVVRIVFATFGLTNWGGDQTACEKCLHSGASSIMFTNMGAAFFTLFHFIFGYSKEACYAICFLVILSNMCQVPAERYKFTDPLLVPFLRKNRSTVKKKRQRWRLVCLWFRVLLVVGRPAVDRFCKHPSFQTSSRIEHQRFSIKLDRRAIKANRRRGFRTRHDTRLLHVILLASLLVLDDGLVSRRGNLRPIQQASHRVLGKRVRGRCTYHTTRSRRTSEESPQDALFTLQTEGKVALAEPGRPRESVSFLRIPGALKQSASECSFVVP